MAKLESVGMLAGGIAHDFNNMLTGIMGNIGLAKLVAPPGGKLHNRLEEAEKASMRAKGLTQQLLTFARGGAPVKKTVSMAGLVRDSVSLALRGSDTRCEFSLPEGLLAAEVDDGQIGQVVANLVINAVEATPGGGVLHVDARNTVVGDEDALPLPEGRYVQITVKDQGIGIPKEYLGRLFEPYFSTKGSHRGLGLATSYSIVKNHGGHIAVESEVGLGTTFHVYLPASAAPAPAPAPAEVQGEQGGPLVGEGRILVMDDDEAIRTLLMALLSHAGYNVEVCRDGAEAIEKYADARAAGEPFDAVIMDMTIPGGMGGREAIRELLRIDPQVKAIVSSGYANDPLMADHRKYGFKGVVTKPYKVRDMVDVLRRVIG